MEDSDERWPIGKDIALSAGVGLFLAIFFLHGSIRPLLATWVACSAAVFFVVSAYHMFGPAESAFRAIGWLVVSGAIGGAVWWLLVHPDMPVWASAAAGAGLVIFVFVLEFVQSKQFRRAILHGEDEDAA